jgi:hypothetical protein
MPRQAQQVAASHASKKNISNRWYPIDHSIGSRSSYQLMTTRDEKPSLHLATTDLISERNVGSCIATSKWSPKQETLQQAQCHQADSGRHVFSGESIRCNVSDELEVGLHAERLGHRLKRTASPNDYEEKETLPFLENLEATYSDVFG